MDCKRRTFLQQFAAAGLLTASNKTVTTKPNLLFIKGGAHNGRFFSVAGYPCAQTPHLDSLAAKGIRYTNALTAYPLAGPAAAALFSGKTAFETGMRMGSDQYTPPLSGIFDSLDTLDEQLAKNGTTCHFHGKWELPRHKAGCYKNMHFHQPDPNSAFYVTSEELEYRCALHEQFSRRPLRMGEKHELRYQLPYTMNPFDRRYGLAPDELIIKNDEVARISPSDCHGTISMDPECTPTAYTAKQVIKTLQQQKHATTPFAITCAFHSPHAPILPCTYWHDRHANDQPSIPGSINDPLTNSSYNYAIQRHLGFEQNPEYRDPEKLKYMIRNYCALIEEIDHWIGQIIETLKNNGQLNNTLIVYTADHGDLLGAHGMIGAQLFYEEALHIPLIMHLPKCIAPAQVVRSPLSATGIAPLILNTLQYGVFKPDPPPASVLIEYDYGRSTYYRDAPNFCLRNERYTWMLSAFGSAPFPDALYDRKSDPLERINLLKTQDRPAEVDSTLTLFKEDLATRLSRVNHPYLEKLNEKWQGIEIPQRRRRHVS